MYSITNCCKLWATITCRWASAVLFSMTIVFASISPKLLSGTSLKELHAAATSENMKGDGIQMVRHEPNAGSMWLLDVMDMMLWICLTVWQTSWVWLRILCTGSTGVGCRAGTGCRPGGSSYRRLACTGTTSQPQRLLLPSSACICACKSASAHLCRTSLSLPPSSPATCCLPLVSRSQHIAPGFLSVCLCCAVQLLALFDGNLELWLGRIAMFGVTGLLATELIRGDALF